MKTEQFSLDASGVAEIAVDGWGFRVVPSRRIGAAVTVKPGAFPVQVAIDDGPLQPIGDDSGQILAAKIKKLRFVGTAGDAWKAQIFESPREGVLPPSQRMTVAVNTQAAGTAVPTVVPTGTDGIEVRPGIRFWTFAAGGTLQLARLWIRTAAGTWVDTLEDFDFTSSAVIGRYVLASASRLYLRAAGASLTCEIDAETEVG